MMMIMAMTTIGDEDETGKYKQTSLFKLNFLNYKMNQSSPIYGIGPVPSFLTVLSE